MYFYHSQIHLTLMAELHGIADNLKFLTDTKQFYVVQPMVINSLIFPHLLYHVKIHFHSVYSLKMDDYIPMARN